MNQLCRCCLLENPTIAYNIFEESLRTELLLCVPSMSVEPDDGLPEVICDLCLLRLREALEFRRCCEANELELRKRYEETSQAIEQALRLNILELDMPKQQQQNQENCVQFAAEPLLANVYGTNDLGFVDSADMSMGMEPLLEEYSNLDMTMLNDMLINDHSLSGSTENQTPEEDPIIKELIAKYLNDPTIDSTTDNLPSMSLAVQCSTANPSNSTTSFFANIASITSSPNKPSYNSTPQELVSSSVEPKKAAPKATHPCTQCEKKFTRNFQLKLHMISVHGVGDGLQYNCIECSKTFASRHSLKYHQKALHSTERPHICQTCERSFVTRTQLASHLRIHTGETKPRIYQCSECDKTWATKSDLKTHMRIHNPNIERRYKCALCTKSFFTQGHLSSHELVHTGEKPYSCALCEKSYQNIGNLNNHIFRSHGEVLVGKRKWAELESAKLVTNEF